eukprot:37058_1
MYNQLPFIKCSQLPISFISEIPKPSYDSTNKNCIIISSYYRESQTTEGIYKYNVETNESELIYKYDNTCKSSDPGQFIDPSNNTLILFGGDFNIFETFDLNKNKMKQKNDKNILNECGSNPQTALIPSPINKIHILDCVGIHYTFDLTNKETIKMKTDSELESNNITYPKLLYIKSKKNCTYLVA